VSVVELDLVLGCKLCKVVVVLLFVPADNVVERGRAEEVLLLQTQLLASIGRVIWVEYRGDILGILTLLNSPCIVRRVKLAKVKGVVWAGAP